MIFRTLLLLFLSVSLTAQSNDWQNYFYANYIIEGAETDALLWLATPNSILQVDKNKGSGELLYFDNTPIERYILDMYQEDAETVAVLSGTNQISKWHAGQWSVETLDPPNGISLRNIIGKTADDTYYMGDYYNVYSWNKEGEIELVPEILATGIPSLQGAQLDNRGWLWLWRYNQLVVFDEQLELVIDQNLTNLYINDLYVDETNSNAWVLNTEFIDIWLAAEERWESFALEDVGLTYGYVIMDVRDNIAMISGNNELWKLSYSSENGLEAESVFTTTDDVYVSAYGTYLDEEKQLWFFNGTNQQLTYWQQSSSFRLLQDSPLLPVSDMMALGIDPQGKVWAGGWGQPAYFMGGRWHKLPVPDEQLIPIQIGARDIVFTATGNPVVGTGALFTFGFPGSELLAWNGASWDTLHEASFGSDFLIFRDINLDQNNNLWVMKEGDQFFSVKSQGEWYRYKIEDMPIDADRFVCLEEGIDGQMWIGTNKGIVSFDGFNFIGYDSTSILLDDGFLRDILVDEEGVVWVSLYQKGIRRWDGQHWEEVPLPIDVPLNASVSYLVSDKNGGIWLSLEGNGVMHYNGQEWKRYHTGNSGLANDWVTNLLVDNKGRLWCSSYESISVFSPDERTIEPFILPLAESLTIYPTPGCCEFMIHWNAIRPGSYNFRLINSLGQEVRHWSSRVDYTGEQLMNFREFDLSTGIYVLQLSKEGVQLASQQLIVSK